jgi:serine/threonine-protein kinase RsbW
MTSSHRPKADSGAVQLLNERGAIERIEATILEAAERHGYAKASKFAIKLSLEEGMANAFHHGHRDLPHEPITVEYSVDTNEVRIRIEDRGPGFNPGVIPDPTLDENLEQPTGRGIMLIRAYMSHVGFNSKGNRVEMVYRKPQG